MSSIVIAGDTSGSVTLQAPAVSGSTVLNLPATSGTIQTSGAGYTTNGVAYASSTSVLTTGSALVFDGTNLGLGVTPSAYWGGNKGLDVGSPGCGLTSRQNNEINLCQNAAFNVYATTGAAAIFGIGNNGQFAWNQAASGTAGSTITFTTRMLLDTSGNLAIGTTSANISGGGAGTQVLTLSASASARNAVIELRGTRTSAGQVSSYIRSFSNSATTPGVDLQFYRGTADTDGFLTISTSGTEQARIDSSGNLLVGTTTASGKLFSSTSSASQPALRAASTSATYNDNVFAIDVDRNTTNNTFYAISYYNNGAAAHKFRVADSGNVTNTNNSYGAISDVKLKENIVDATPKLSALQNVRIVNYNRIGSEEKELGVIAQELEQVFPALVETHIDRDAEGNDLGTTTKSVKYSVFVPMLIKAIQEQQALITTLTDRISVLENK